MRKIVFISGILFFGLTSSALAAVNYSRSPSGNPITSPVTINVSVDDFSDFGFTENINSWLILMQSQEEWEEFSDCYSSDTLSVSNIFSIPVGEQVAVIVIRGYEQNCEGSEYQYELEYNSGELIFTSSGSYVPPPSGFLSSRPEIAITVPKKGLSFSSSMKIEYQATDKNDLGSNKEKTELGLGLTPASIFYSDKIYEWNHTIIDEFDKVLIAKGLPASGQYIWSIPKELADGSLYRIIIDAVDNLGDIGENISDFFTIDHTAPVFTILADRSEITKTGEVKITAQSSKDLVAPPKLTVTQRGYKAVEVLMSGAGKLFEGIYKIVTGFDGPAVVDIFGEDQSGNVSTGIVSGQRFSVGIEPPPKPIIDFPLQEKVVTKENGIAVRGKVREDTEVILLLNGTTEFKTKPDKEGVFFFEKISLDPQYHNGENIFNIISRDEDGNESQPAIITVKFNFDPEVSFSFPAKDSTLSATSTIKISANDKNNDILLFSYEIKPASGDNWTLVASSTPNKRYVLDTRNFSDGQYALRVTASDGFAEAQATSSVFSIKNFLPVITFASGELMITNNKNIVITGDIIAPENPEGKNKILELEYSTDNGKLWKKVDVGGGAESFLSSAFSVSLSDLKEDEYSILFRAKDSRGFYGRAVKTVIVDFGPPEKPVVSSTKTSLLITDRDDEDSGLAGTQFTVSGTAEPKSEVSVVLADKIFKATAGGDGAFAVHGVTLKQHNKNDFVVFATDKARNKSPETSASVVYNNPPIIKFISPRQDRGLHGVSDIQWKIEDIDNDSIANVSLSFRKGNNPFSVLTKSAADNAFKWDVSGFQEGSGYQLKLEATDSITPTSQTIDIFVDNTPPEIELSPLNQNSFKKAFTLSGQGKASDNLSGVEFIEYSINRKDWFKTVMTGGYLNKTASFKISHPFKLGDGEYDFGARAVDAAGNISKPVFQKIIVDMTPPRIGSYTVSLGQLNFLPKNGSFEIIAGNKIKLIISLEQDTKEAFLELGGEKINLVKNKATGLWEAEIIFGVIGKSTMKITAIDLLDNKISDKEVGMFKIIPAGKISSTDENGKTNPVEGAEIKTSIWNEDSNSFVDWQAENFGGSNPTASLQGGEYKLALPAGKFRLLVEKAGFERIKTNDFILSDPSFINFDFTLVKLRGVWGFLQNIIGKIGL